MLLDDSFYMRAICEFRNCFQEVFFEQMVFKEETHFFEKRGNFRLFYNYIPLNYTIIVENELRTFTITIEDSEGAKNSLYRIEKFDNQLCEKNIRKSIGVLKKVLDKKEFDLYLYVDKKLYRKNSNGLKRVKDIRELLNG